MRTGRGAQRSAPTAGGSRAWPGSWSRPSTWPFLRLSQRQGQGHGRSRAGYVQESRFLQCQTAVWISIRAFPVTSCVTSGNEHNLAEPSSLGSLSKSGELYLSHSIVMVIQ